MSDLIYVIQITNRDNLVLFVTMEIQLNLVIRKNNRDAIYRASNVKEKGREELGKTLYLHTLIILYQSVCKYNITWESINFI